VQHLTNLYAAEHYGVERFILTEGGLYTALFWIVQIVLGGIVPLLLIYHPAARDSRVAAGIAAALVIVGGFAQVYVIIIGGQAYPLVLFPGMEVSSSFFDGVVNGYVPTFTETLLGLGGVALGLALIAVAARILPLLPTSLADADIDPHYRVAETRPQSRAPSAEPAAASVEAAQPADGV
jgi:molybdopterin-containing oxidoreductase family membrane subunit